LPAATFPGVSGFTTARNRRLDADAYTEALRPCFLTVRAYEYQSPFTSPDLNDATVAILLDTRLVSRCLLYAYCLMPDHLHVLAAPEVDGASVLELIDRFKGSRRGEAGASA
jgi:REP element-mobilizing transposase RayT